MALLDLQSMVANKGGHGGHGSGISQVCSAVSNTICL
jgi:hypothetical protein